MKIPKEKIAALTAQNGAFERGLQVFWDSTSLGLLKTCPKKYALKMIFGWNTAKESVHLWWGRAYHSALEKYDHARAAGTSFESALDQALQVALEQSVEYITTDDGQTICLPLCSDEKGQKTRETLCRAVVWYIDNFKDDPVETIVLSDSKAAVEVSFRFEISDFKTPFGSSYFLCGHFDKLGKYGGSKYVLDRKTTGSTLSPYFFKRFSPNNQMSLYSAAGNIVLGSPIEGVIIDACQTAVTFCRFERGFASRTPGQISEWWEETQVWIKLAETFFDNAFYPANDEACDKYGGCQFREICGKDPSVQETFLEANFVRSSWDPTEVR